MKLPDKYDDPVVPAPVAAPTDAQTPLTDEREMNKSINFTLLCDSCGKPISLHDRLAMCPKNSVDFGQIDPPKATGRELFYAWDGNNQMHCVVNADFARQLEREVAELRRQLAEAQDRSVFERNHANQAIQDMQVQEQRAETAEADARELWEFLAHLDFSKIHATIEKHRAKYGKGDAARKGEKP